jgi:hypothetical protein
MKTRLTVVLAIFLSLQVLGSTTPEPKIPGKVFSVTNFGSINVHRQHNSAALSWIFNSPSVRGFIIQRSYDAAYFTTIDQVGISSGHWNKYLDNSVEPGTIYYKIIAIMNDGSREESPVASVRIVRHR